MQYKFKTIFILSCIVFYSCKHDTGMIKPICTTPETISFSNNIIPLFIQNCSTSGCHSGSNAAAHLNLDAAVAYTSLTKSGSGYIDTISPSASLLYAQMVSASNPMPKTGRLDDCKTNLILKWIQQKAKNN